MADKVYGIRCGEGGKHGWFKNNDGFVWSAPRPVVAATLNELLANRLGTLYELKEIGPDGEPVPEPTETKPEAPATPDMVRIAEHYGRSYPVGQEFVYNGNGSRLCCKLLADGTLDRGIGKPEHWLLWTPITPPAPVVDWLALWRRFNNQPLEVRTTSKWADLFLSYAAGERSDTLRAEMEAILALPIAAEVEGEPSAAEWHVMQKRFTDAEKNFWGDTAIGFEACNDLYHQYVRGDRSRALYNRMRAVVEVEPEPAPAEWLEAQTLIRPVTPIDWQARFNAQKRRADDAEAACTKHKAVRRRAGALIRGLQARVDSLTAASTQSTAIISDLRARVAALEPVAEDAPTQPERYRLAPGRYSFPATLGDTPVRVPVEVLDEYDSRGLQWCKYDGAMHILLADYKEREALGDAFTDTWVSGSTLTPDPASTPPVTPEVPPWAAALNLSAEQVRELEDKPVWRCWCLSALEPSWSTCCACVLRRSAVEHWIARNGGPPCQYEPRIDPTALAAWQEQQAKSVEDESGEYGVWRRLPFSKAGCLMYFPGHSHKMSGTKEQATAAHVALNHREAALMVNGSWVVKLDPQTGAPIFPTEATQ